MQIYIIREGKLKALSCIPGDNTPRGLRVVRVELAKSDLASFQYPHWPVYVHNWVIYCLLPSLAGSKAMADKLYDLERGLDLLYRERLGRVYIDFTRDIQGCYITRIN